MWSTPRDEKIGPANTNRSPRRIPRGRRADFGASRDDRARSNSCPRAERLPDKDTAHGRTLRSGQLPQGKICVFRHRMGGRIRPFTGSPQIPGGRALALNVVSIHSAVRIRTALCRGSRARIRVLKRLLPTTRHSGHDHQHAPTAESERSRHEDPTAVRRGANLAGSPSPTGMRRARTPPQCDANHSAGRHWMRDDKRSQRAAAAGPPAPGTTHSAAPESAHTNPTKSGVHAIASFPGPNRSGRPIERLHRVERSGKARRFKKKLWPRDLAGIGQHERGAR